MKVIGTALAVTLLAALGAGSASGAGSAGVSSVAATAAGQGVAAAVSLEPAWVPSGLARVGAELSAIALTQNENDSDADDENDADDDNDAKDAPKDKTSPKHEGALDRLRGVLDLLVAAGTITAAQETAILDAAKDAFTKKPDAKPEQARAGKFHFTGAIFKVVREYLGVTQKDIEENAKAGKSLAELALAKGKSRDGLILAIVTTVDKPTAATSVAVAALVDAKGRPNAGRKGENEKSKHAQNEKGKTTGRSTR